jgi:DNA polymerase-1
MNSYQIDEKLQPILRKMEKAGIRLDIDFLNNLNQKVSLSLLKIEQEIYELTCCQFNLNSPKQLAEVLYTKLAIDPARSGIKRRKTHHSTSAENLIKIKNLHPCIKQILKYRGLAKLKNTYLDPLPKMVDKNSRLHTTYAIDTASGRLSSKNPNLQNIPTAVKNNEYFDIRRAFVADKGYKIIAADYSQIELRIAAHFSHDKNMLEIFAQNKDIHSATAQELGIDRKTAKTVNFSILYGVSAYGLSETLEIPHEEAQILIDKYFLAFPRLKELLTR